MLICYAEQKLSEWSPSVTLEEYFWLVKIIKKEKECVIQEKKK